MGAKHANWFVTSAKTTGWLRETELVPKTQGIIEAIKQTGFALALAKHGKVPPPVPPHVAKDVTQSRALYDLVKSKASTARSASCRESTRWAASSSSRRRKERELEEAVE